MNWHLKLLHEPGITPFSLAHSILIYTFNIAVGYSHLCTLVCFYCSFFPGGSDGKASAYQVQSLGWEDPLEKEMATHSSILAWKPHGWRSLPGYKPWSCKESDTTEWLHFFTLVSVCHVCLCLTLHVTLSYDIQILLT